MAFEYKTLQFEDTSVLGGHLTPRELDKELNELGGQGWELVSSFDIQYRQTGGTRNVVCIFKRKSTAVTKEMEEYRKLTKQIEDIEKMKNKQIAPFEKKREAIRKKNPDIG
jgi:hypothetical protein